MTRMVEECRGGCGRRCGRLKGGLSAFGMPSLLRPPVAANEVAVDCVHAYAHPCCGSPQRCLMDFLYAALLAPAPLSFSLRLAV